MSTYHKIFFAAYYQYRQSKKKPQQFVLKNCIENYKTKLDGKPGGVIQLPSKIVTSKKEISSRRSTIHGPDKMVIAYLYFSKYLRKIDLGKIGFGNLSDTPVPFIVMISKKGKKLEFFVTDESKIDMFLLLEKYETGDLDEEIDRIRKESTNTNITKPKNQKP